MPSSASTLRRQLLPPSPPRRSSDLGAEVLGPQGPHQLLVAADPAGRDQHRRGPRRELAGHLPARAGAARAVVSRQHAPPHPGHAAVRSEEHTSELQSRGHRVCRLLLRRSAASFSPLPLPAALPILVPSASDHRDRTSCSSPPIPPVATSTAAALAANSPVTSRLEPAPRGPSSAASTLPRTPVTRPSDRKSTRLNSSHVAIAYAVFCFDAPPPASPPFPSPPLFRSWCRAPRTTGTAPAARRRRSRRSRPAPPRPSPRTRRSPPGSSRRRAGRRQPPARSPAPRSRGRQIGRAHV